MYTFSGQFLDRYGRTRTMGIIIFGPLLSDILTFIVFLFSDTLPGKYWFLVIAPIMEGIMGGEQERYDSVFCDRTAIQPLHPSWLRKHHTCVMSRNHLICRSLTLAKCHSRLIYLTSSARNFSLLIGIFYAGGAIGPVLGGFLNQRTNSVMAAFYAATVIHLLYALLAWFAMPESITKATMIHARNRYADELASVVDADTGPFRRQALVFVKSFWDSFPLHVLAPKPTPNLRRKDWNMTWLAISAGLINAIMVRPATWFAAHAAHRIHRDPGVVSTNMLCTPLNGRLLMCVVVVVVVTRSLTFRPAGLLH